MFMFQYHVFRFLLILKNYFPIMLAYNLGELYSYLQYSFNLILFKYEVYAILLSVYRNTELRTSVLF